MIGFISYEDVSLYKVHIYCTILTLNPEIPTLRRREIIRFKEDLILHVFEFCYNKRLCGIRAMLIYWRITSIDIIDLAQKISGKVYFVTKPVTNNSISEIGRLFGLLSYCKHGGLKW